MNIRKYQVTDKQNLQNICIITAEKQKNEQNNVALNLLYNDYYTEQEPENCFVVCDEQNSAVGYVVCSIDYKNYKDIFIKEYLPKVKKLSLSKYLIKKLSFVFEDKFAKEYPAHLHINLSPNLTGKGSGSALLNALFLHLKQQNVAGIMLCVGSKNTRAIKFYKKHDFVPLKAVPFALFMGKKL